MKQITSLVLLHVFTFCLPGTIMKSDKDNSGLRGSVRAVRTKTVKLSIKGGKPVEETWLLPNVVTYDTNGRKAEQIFYKHDGSLHFRDVFVYDAQGALIKLSRFDSNNSLMDETTYTYDPVHGKVEKHHYDSSGRLIEKSVDSRHKKGNREVSATYKADGHLVRKTVEFYDDRGREIEIYICYNDLENVADDTAHDNMNTIGLNEAKDRQTIASSVCDDANFAGKVMITYDDKKNLAEHFVYKADGSLEAKKVVIKDVAGNTTEVTDYMADGKLRSKEIYTREFDSCGNWIKQTKSQWSAKTGRLEPAERVYREITYW